MDRPAREMICGAKVPKGDKVTIQIIIAYFSHEVKLSWLFGKNILG